MNEVKSDLESRADIERLVDSFYDKVRKDELIGPVFAHVDWPAHLPTMYNFWASMMLGEMSYRGNPFQKHVKLPIGSEHFARWLDLFEETVDAHFSGPRATEIKQRAQSIAGIFQHKMGLLK
ncbi:MAG: group III truncated hemoglobin [Bacteroidota bacterium]|jgi:hemoglobin|nr:MAG: sec-independent protein translocase TatC [Bacteroidota bacterium]